MGSGQQASSMMNSVVLVVEVELVSVFGENCPSAINAPNNMLTGISSTPPAIRRMPRHVPSFSESLARAGGTYGGGVVGAVGRVGGGGFP